MVSTGTTRKAEIADPAMAGDTYVEMTQLVKQRMIQMGIVPPMIDTGSSGILSGTGSWFEIINLKPNRGV